MATFMDAFLDAKSNGIHLTPHLFQQQQRLNTVPQRLALVPPQVGEKEDRKKPQSRSDKENINVNSKSQLKGKATDPEELILLDLYTLKKPDRSALLTIRQIRNQNPKSLECEAVEKLLLINLVNSVLARQTARLPADFPRWVRRLEKTLDADRAQTCVATSAIFHDYYELREEMSGQEQSVGRPFDLSVSNQQPAFQTEDKVRVCFFLGCKSVFRNHNERLRHAYEKHCPASWVCVWCERSSRHKEKISQPHKALGWNVNGAMCGGSEPYPHRKEWINYPMLLKRPMVNDPLFPLIDKLLFTNGF